VRTSFTPNSAAAIAVANPIPLDAPVMTVTCWSRVSASSKLLGVRLGIAGALERILLL
jgi:hypothetical protein